LKPIEIKEKKMSSQLDFTSETYRLQYYSSIFIGSIGFITNFMNIGICQRKKLTKNTTMGLYNTFMSIFNVLAIVFVGFLNVFPQSIGEMELVTSTMLSCKLIPYFSRVVIQCVAWSNVLVTFDRMLMVCIQTRNHRILMVNLKLKKKHS